MAANEIANGLQATFSVQTNTTTAGMAAAGIGFIAGSLVRLGAGQYTVDLELPLAPFAPPTFDPPPEALIMASANSVPGVAVTLDVSPLAVPNLYNRLLITTRDSAGDLADTLCIANITIVKFPTNAS